MNVLPLGTLTLPLVAGTWEPWTRLNETRCQYRWPSRLFMKFLVWATYNAYIIMDSYRPYSHAGHRFRTFHMFVGELCLQLVSDYCTVHCIEAEPSSQNSFVCSMWDNTTQNIPQLPLAQPLRGLLCQLKQVSEEAPCHRIQTCPTSGGKPCSGVPHATSTSVSMSAAHVGVTITLKFSFGIEPSPE